MGSKITEFVLKKGQDESILDQIMNKTTCSIKVVEMGDGKKVEIFGDNSCRAMLKEANLGKG